METSINERIKWLIDSLGINVNDFVSATGVGSPEKIYRILRMPEAKPSYEMIVHILSAYKNLNPDWLIRGIGPAWRNEGEYSEANFVEDSELPDIQEPKIETVYTKQNKVEKIEITITLKP